MGIDFFVAILYNIWQGGDKMSIVKYKNQSGVTYAYEQTSSYDSERKQSRPVRKYLGRVDPETGEIIPTTGKRGRPPKKAAEPVTVTAVQDYKSLYEIKCREIDVLQNELENAKKHNNELSSQIGELKEVILTVRARLDSVKCL